MKNLLPLCVIFLGLSGAEAVRHSLQYFYTASSGIPSFPEFLTVGMVDGEPFSYYDCKIGKEIPKQDWMAKAEGPEYWDRQTQISIGAQQSFKNNIDVAKQRFNQTGGVHIFQWMYGCEWDEETGEGNGYQQYGYDGKDFIILDLQKETWVAPVQQAAITKNKWDSNKVEFTRYKSYVTQDCREWLKKYVNYGKSSLMRTDVPKVSLLQKTSSSPVSCHATGFYPNRAEMVWKKDGVEFHDGVHKGEILTNNDGTFQMTVNLDVSSVKPEDWDRYTCVFQLSGVNEDIVTRLNKADIETNERSSFYMIITVVVAAVVLLAAIAGIGFIIYKKMIGKRPPSPVPSEDRDIQEEMLSKA
uniref:MHC class I alpha antigen n=2 Tax=Oreochromis niloticus TaxID=8128 RepID=G7Z0A2_ORENI|nr:MHC class I alpha antigen [Oreochromis niloticus]